MNKPHNYPQDPATVWNRFFEITQVPRPSKKEEKIRAYLLAIAKDKGLKHQVDATGNVIIYVPGTSGYENHAPVILQNHMDMVCDATPDRKIDFTNDPIITKIEGDWIMADRTTLGADNGIGVAFALGVIDDKTAKHPPLELLFTVDEETGLGGALNVDPQYLQGRKMLNLDTEDWGKIYIGCAGGMDTHLEKNYVTEHSASKDLNQLASVEVHGFCGGHSGVEIHKQQGNALKFLMTIMHRLKVEGHRFQFRFIKGGKAHNIIPRDIVAEIAMDQRGIEALKTMAQEVAKEWKTFLPKDDLNFSASIQLTNENKGNFISESDSRGLVALAMLFPHGALKYDLESPEMLVSASSNMAKLNLEGGHLFMETSIRFFEKNESTEIKMKLDTLGEIFGLKVHHHNGYPNWRPQFSGNPMLDLAKKVYKEMTGEEAEVLAIHAGLECGIIKDRIGGQVDVISIGTTIHGAHSPTERMHIPTVGKCYELMKRILAEL